MLDFKKFKKTKENFVCVKCGNFVEGNGYTNHCPKCLWSRHVDVNPGDRKETCLGMMKPIELETKSGRHLIVHECEVCGYKKRNKTVPEDNYEAIIKLSNCLE